MKIDFDVLRTRQLDKTTFSNFVNDLCVERSSNINGKTARAYYDIIHDKNNKDDVIVAYQIRLLAYLIPPPGKVNKIWKPSIPECEDSLIVLAAVRMN